MVLRSPGYLIVDPYSLGLLLSLDQLEVQYLLIAVSVDLFAATTLPPMDQYHTEYLCGNQRAVWPVLPTPVADLYLTLVQWQSYAYVPAAIGNPLASYQSLKGKLGLKKCSYSASVLPRWDRRAPEVTSNQNEQTKNFTCLELQCGGPNQRLKASFEQTSNHSEGFGSVGTGAAGCRQFVNNRGSETADF